MRIFWRTVYSGLLLPLALLLLRVAAIWNAKVRESLAGRNGIWQRLEAGARRRDATKKLVWFHVASAGELLQAEPVMARLIEAGYECAVTVTSITGYRWGARRNPDLPGPLLLDFLPLDTRANARRMFLLLRPAALVFVKFDLWPNLIWEADRVSLPLFLISATLHGGSRRYSSRAGRSVYGSLYGCFAGIFAVSQGDCERFLHTCPDHSNVKNIGDTRFDSILERKQAIHPVDLPAYVKARPTIIVGSSWPADEAEVLPVVREALAEFPDLVTLLVPHEVDEPHLAAIEASFGTTPPVRLSRLAAARGEPRAILVDSVGKLSALYHYADLAYVGGSFGAGVHNVAEPLVMGVPVIFGPLYHNSPEAVEFLERGFCFSIAGAEQLRPVLFDFLSDLTRCHTIGEAAAQAIQAKGGAAEKCFTLIRTALE